MGQNSKNRAILQRGFLKGLTLCVFVVLSMPAIAPAFAEETKEDTKSKTKKGHHEYVHEDGGFGFSFQYPNARIVDASNAEELGYELFDPNDVWIELDHALPEQKVVIHLTRLSQDPGYQGVKAYMLQEAAMHYKSKNQFQDQMVRMGVYKNKRVVQRTVMAHAKNQKGRQVCTFFSHDGEGYKLCYRPQSNMVQSYTNDPYWKVYGAILSNFNFAL